MRRLASISGASALARHDHVAWCGDGPDALDRLAVAVFSGAAARGEQMVFVSKDPDPDRLAELDDRHGLIERGELHLVDVRDVYDKLFEPPAQLAVMEGFLDRALAAGHTGVCVVADNSSMVAGSSEHFAAWLALEVEAERLRASWPLTGVCYFDRRAVVPGRLADLAVIHPVLSAGFDEPSFQLVVDGDVVHMVGEVDRFSVDQLHRLLSSSTTHNRVVLDLSGLDFIDHRALLTLNQLALEGHGLRVRAAKPLVRHIWQLLDLQAPALEFC